jgi:hypothetical protein
MATKFTSWSKIKKGQKFQVVSRTYGTSSVYELNKTYIAKKGGSGYSNYIYTIVEGKNSPLYAKDCILINETISEMKSDLAKIESERKTELQKIETKYKSLKQDLESKIKFCEESKLEEYNADVHKVYKALKTLNTSSSDGEKAKIIAELIKK